MKLIVGLGNPGVEYENTRHNAGFMLVNRLAELHDLPFSINKYTNAEVATDRTSVIFAKPQTFMNDSGNGVLKLMEHYTVTTEQIYVVHDDLDLKLGEYKIQFGVGPKDHKGILSIEQHLKIPGFWRIRVGVDNRDPINRVPGENYVLLKFTPEELKTLRSVFTKIVVDLGL